MSEGVVSTGTCIAFSAVAPATKDQAGYEALTWTEWGEVTDFGSLGTTANITEFKTVCDGATHKRPASKDFGSMDITAANVETNAAQILLQEAIDNTPVTAVYTRLTLSTGAVRYFRAYPGSLTDDVGDPDAIFMTSVNLVIDGQPVRVAAP